MIKNGRAVAARPLIGIRYFAVLIVLLPALARVSAAQAEKHWHPLGGVRVDFPQGAVLEGGGLYGREKTIGDFIGTTGTVVALGLGTGGGRVTAGYHSRMRAYGAAYTYRAAYLYTWGSPWNWPTATPVPTKEHFVGVEGRTGFLYSTFGIGLFRRVGGRGDAPRTILNASVGFGY